MKIRQRTLLILSLIILPFTFGIFQILPSVIGPKWGYVGGLLLYWVYSLCTAWLVTGGQWACLQAMVSHSRNTKYARLINAAAFLPVIGVFFVAFLPHVGQLTLVSGILLVVVAVLNGTIEEIYWRGLYVLAYPRDWRIGLGLSTLLFGAWHISLWFAHGITYQGGIVALIGGAYFMGLLWAWVARSVGNIRACVLAHILVNLFAFTGLFVENGF